MLIDQKSSHRPVPSGRGRNRIGHASDYSALDTFGDRRLKATPSMTAEEQRSIAVLPFANESVAEENAGFFANGMHDELLTQLQELVGVTRKNRCRK